MRISRPRIVKRSIAPGGFGFKAQGLGFRVCETFRV